MIWLLLIKIAAYAAFIPLIWQGGNRFCRFVLHVSGSPPRPADVQESATTPDEATRTPAPPARGDALAAGRYIGGLERMLISFGVLMSRWEIMAAVIALKTVARYKELDKQMTAEYFLIGSLASILWAVSATLLLLLYDANFGMQIAPVLQGLLVAN